MKKYLSALVLAGSLSFAAQSSANLLDATFTSDNEVTAFSYTVDGVLTSVDLTSVANLDDWTRSSSLSIAVASGASYEFIWDIENYGNLSSGNPVAFLADVSFDGVSYLSNSTDWEVKSAGTGNAWESAVLNFGNGTSANNQGNNIWGGNAPSDISSSAQWLWDGLASGNNDTMSFRLSVNALDTVDASAPTMFAIFGAGMLFLGFSRKQK